MKALFNACYALLFIALVLLVPITLYLFAKPVLIFYLTSLALTFCRFVLKWENWLTLWATTNMIAIDQWWQVMFAPLLNLGVTTEHRFGAPDETASSVVGKNLQATGELRWKVIEWCLSIVLEAGKPHAVPNIEDDEGYYLD